MPVACSTSTISGTITSGQPSRIRLNVPSKSKSTCHGASVRFAGSRAAGFASARSSDDFDVRAGEGFDALGAVGHSAIILFVIV